MPDKRPGAFTGVEPWQVGQSLVPNVERGKFVRILDIRPLPKIGKAKKPAFFAFTVLIHNPRLETGDGGAMRIIRFEREIGGVRFLKSGEAYEIDILRIRRRFEIDANSFNNRSKARKPDYLKRFLDMDLSKPQWRHFYPKEL